MRVNANTEDPWNRDGLANDSRRFLFYSAATRLPWKTSELNHGSFHTSPAFETSEM